MDAFNTQAGGLLDPDTIARRLNLIEAGMVETLGAKLRRLARAAEISTPLINPPWTVPPAWSAGATVVPSQVRSNSNGWYVVITGGVTAGAGGPTSTSTGQPINDNTAVWTYLGGPTISASDPLAPTFASTTVDPGGNRYTAQGQPNVFRIYGAYAANGGGSQWAPKTFNRSAGNPVAAQPRISFFIDAIKPYIILGSNTPPVRFVINAFDGKGPRYFSPDCFAAGAGTQFVSFDFTTVGGRKERQFWVEGSKTGNLDFGGVLVATNESVWAPSTVDDIRAVLVNDSLGDGSSYGPMLPGCNLASRIGKHMGWSDVWSFATGSTGYIATASGTAYNYGDRIPEAVSLLPDILGFMGSTNDLSQSPSVITATALADFRQARALGYTGPIVVFGLWPINSANVPTVETAVQAAVTQFADPLNRTFFIPINNDPVLPWVTGAWNNTLNTSSVNASMMISGDNTHPADVGTAYLAVRQARSLRTNVLPCLR